MRKKYLEISILLLLSLSPSSALKEPSSRQASPSTPAAGSAS
jgi:hypothetical protein